MRKLFSALLLLRAATCDLARAEETPAEGPAGRTPPDWSEVFVRLDSDSSGTLNLTEFLEGPKVMHRNHPRPPREPQALREGAGSEQKERPSHADREARMKAAFVQAAGESGELDQAQFTKLMQSLPKPRRPS